MLLTRLVMTPTSEAAVVYRVMSVPELAVSTSVGTCAGRIKAHLFRRYKFNVGYNDSGHPHFHSFRIINWKEYSNNYSSQYADIFNFVFFRAKHFHIRDWHSYRKSLRPSNKSYVKLDVDPGHRPLPNWILRMLGHTWRRVLQDIP
jgi:hypothetical protein